MSKSNVKKEKISIIAGFPRTGTTFLYYILQKHPSIFVPYRKELAFFIYYYDKGVDWYLNHFKGMKVDQIGVDISSLYLLDKSAIKRIKELNPHIKIISGVRDPVELALSLYGQCSTYSLRMPLFEDFVQSFTFDRVNKKLSMQIAENFIPRTLDTIKNIFGENLLLYSFDVFKRSPLTVVQAIESFLSIKPYFNENNFENVVINAANRKNIRIVSQILATGDIFPRMLRALFPANLIRLVRARSLRASGREVGTGIQNYPLEHIRLAEEILADQSAYFKDFFSEAEIQLGNGRPFSLRKM